MNNLTETIKNLEIDKKIENKRIFVFNQDKEISDETLLRGMCNLYGLKYTSFSMRRKIGFYTYTMDNLDDFFEILWTSLPMAIQDFIRGYSVFQKQKILNKEIRPYDESTYASMSLSQLYISAYAELTIRLENRLLETKKGFIKGDSLTEREKMLYLFLKFKGLLTLIVGGYFGNPPKRADFMESRVRASASEVELKGHKLIQAEISFEKFVPSRNQWRTLMDTGGIITMIGEKL